MRCPECGATQSTVLETRGQVEPVTQRRRECFNGHRFTTYEVSEALAKTIAKHAETHARQLDTAAQRARRNRAIAREVRTGEQMQAVAQKYGLAASTVSEIIKTVAPDLSRKRKHEHP